MTTETFTPAPKYTIDGIGPYHVPHAYSAATDILAVVNIDGALVDVPVADISLVPLTSEIKGDVWLDATYAATNDGLDLYITRQTFLEQGWVGVGGSREKGLEYQMDRLTRRIQDAAQGADTSLRVLKSSAKAYVPNDQSVPIWDEAYGGFLNGPNASDIAAAQAYAAQAAASATIASTYANQPFTSRAALIAATVEAEVKIVAFFSSNGHLLYCVDGAVNVCATSNAGTRNWVPSGRATPDHYQENTTPKITDMITGFTGMIAWMNTNATKGRLLPGAYLCDATIPELTTPGIGIHGEGQGNSANLVPSVDAPTMVILTGTGRGFLLTNDDQELIGFRLTSDAARYALAFDIDQPGVRVEPADTATGRADRCKIDLRIDKQPGDGVLSVGLTPYLDTSNCDIYECKGNGRRSDPGIHPDLTRTNTFYIFEHIGDNMRIGFCGGHAIAISHPDADQQAEIGIRCIFEGMDSFGNGIDTSIMYPTFNGIYHDVWIFGEQCEVNNSAPSGLQGYGLTKEVLGGIHIQGRDNKLLNNRYIETAQPISWEHLTAQPNSGLIVNEGRLVNTTLTHDELIDIEDLTSTGLNVTWARMEFLTAICDAGLADAIINRPDVFEVRKTLMLDGNAVGGVEVTIADDAVASITPPRTAGRAIINNIRTVASIDYPAKVHSGEFWYDVGGSLDAVDTTPAGLGANLDVGTTTLTGTTGTDTNTTVSAQTGVIQIENRTGNECEYQVTFL